MTKKIIIGILIFVMVGTITFGIVWIVRNKDALSVAMSGTALYTKDDIDAAYKDGYDNALLNKQDYVTQIEELRATLGTLTSEKAALEKQRDDYKSQYGASSAEVERLNNQIAEKDEQIAGLQTSLESYKKLEEEMQNANKVIATFTVDGAVYAVQACDVGATVSIEDPKNTDDMTFNYWTVDGEEVDLTSYVINENTTFVANVTYTTYRTVKFTVDGAVYDTQEVLKGDCATLPEAPIKEGYEFIGWTTLEGAPVDVETYVITASREFVAAFEQKTGIIVYSVNGEVFKTETVAVGETYTLPDASEACTNVFMGWYVGDVVDDTTVKGAGTEVVMTEEMAESGVSYKAVDAFGTNGVWKVTQKVNMWSSYIKIEANANRSSATYYLKAYYGTYLLSSSEDFSNAKQVNINAASVANGNFGWDISTDNWTNKIIVKSYDKETGKYTFNNTLSYKKTWIYDIEKSCTFTQIG